MIDIASRSHGATSSLVYDIHHIAISVLRLMERSIAFLHTMKASTSYGPFIMKDPNPD